MKSKVHIVTDYTDTTYICGFELDSDDIRGKRILVISDSHGVRTVTPIGNTVDIDGLTYSIDLRAVPPMLSDCWSLDDIHRFVHLQQTPEGVYEWLKAVIREHIDLQEEGQYGLLSAWIIASYFNRMFYAVPYLHFYGPKASGKSKGLELLELVAFNGRKTTTITEAALGHYMGSMRTSLLVDQAANLNSDLRELLVDSYKKRGGTRVVTSQRKDGSTVVQRYETYGMKAFASINPLHYDLADRCIRVPMLRSKRPTTDIIGNEEVWSMARQCLYRLLLMRWQDARDIYDGLPPAETRADELWKPIVSMLKLSGVDATEVQQVYQVFHSGITSSQPAIDVQVEALFQVLHDRAVLASEFEITATEIFTNMNILLEENDRVTRPQWVGKELGKYNLNHTAQKRTRKKITYYRFTREVVMDVVTRYMPIANITVLPTVQNNPTVSSRV